jgi:hypothetical protein
MNMTTCSMNMTTCSMNMTMYRPAHYKLTQLSLLFYAQKFYKRKLRQNLQVLSTCLCLSRYETYLVMLHILHSGMHVMWRHSWSLFIKSLIFIWCKNFFSSQSWFAVQYPSSYRISWQ